MSFVSVSGAKANAAAESSGWDFNATHTAAHNAWNSMLGKVQIAGGTPDQQVSFYTALYHSLMYPMVWSDTDRNYMGVDGKVHTVEYTNFSGWDTYRTQSQLAGLIAPAQSSDTVQSMLDDYAQSGMLPKWDLNNGETYVMVGDPADPIMLPADGRVLRLLQLLRADLHDPGVQRGRRGDLVSGRRPRRHRRPAVLHRPRTGLAQPLQLRQRLHPVA